MSFDFQTIVTLDSLYSKVNHPLKVILIYEMVIWYQLVSSTFTFHNSKNQRVRWQPVSTDSFCWNIYQNLILIQNCNYYVWIIFYRPVLFYCVVRHCLYLLVFFVPFFFSNLDLFNLHYFWIAIAGTHLLNEAIFSTTSGFLSSR